MAITKNALIEIINKKQDTIWDVRPQFLTMKKETYFNRALIEIFNNNKLVEISRTPAGAKSIFEGIKKALTMGMQIGGATPHCYLVPMKDKVTFVPTFDGYKYIALSEPNPVLKNIVIRGVYEKEADTLEIDFGNNTVKGHKACLTGDRGKLIGVYGILTDLNGNDHVEWMPTEEINRIRDTYSQSYKFQKNQSPWTTEYDKQALKTAGKQFLKPYAMLKEGLALALEIEDIEEVPENVSSRVESRLANMNIEDAEVIEEEKHEEVNEVVEPDTTDNSGKLF